MKKFKFKLEQVLKYRQMLKEFQEAKLARANQALEETKTYLEFLDAKQHDVYSAMIDNSETGFSLIDHQNQEVFNHMIIHEQSKEKTRYAKRARAKEFEETRYQSLAKDHKALEKLKDKALALHQKALLEQEMKQIDDLNNSRFRAQ